MLKMFHGLRPGRGSSYFIACSDAPVLHKLMADLVLTGTNDHTTINAFLLAKGTGDFLISPGTVFTAGTISTQAVNQRIRGSLREGTQLFATNSAGSNAAIVLLAHLRCSIEDVQIHGNSANNAGRTSMRGITITAGSCTARRIHVFFSAGNGIDITGAIQEIILDSVYVQNSTLVGINLAASGGIGCMISNCSVYASGTIGCTVSGTGHKIVNSIFHTSTNHGLADTGSFTQISNCEFQSNTQFGISLGGSGASLTGGLARSNGWGVIIVTGSTATKVVGIVVNSNTTGIQHDSSAGPALISGCVSYNNNAYGIYSNSDYCAILGNHVHGNGLGAASTYAGILLDTSADNCYIANNKVWRGASGNRQSYGIQINGGSNNYVGQNDLFEGGMTADYGDSGVNTRRSTKVVLDYTAAADLLNAFGATGGVAFNVTADQTFRVDSALDVVTIQSRGGAYVIMGGSTSEWTTYLLIDGATIYRLTGGGLTASAHGFFPFTGTVSITGLTVGNHTVRIVAISSSAATVYCRAATQPTYEHAAIQVVEYAR